MTNPGEIRLLAVHRLTDEDDDDLWCWVEGRTWEEAWEAGITEDEARHLDDASLADRTRGAFPTTQPSQEPSR